MRSSSLDHAHWVEWFGSKLLARPQHGDSSNWGGRAHTNASVDLASACQLCSLDNDAVDDVHGRAVLVPTACVQLRSKAAQ